MTLKFLKRHFLEHFSQNLSNISVYKYWKKYSISLLSRELPILDIDTFPLSLSINWRYSLDEYWLPWSECITKFLGKLTFLILSITNELSLYKDRLKPKIFLVLWSNNSRHIYKILINIYWRRYVCNISSIDIIIYTIIVTRSNILKRYSYILRFFCSFCFSYSTN